MPRTAGPQSSGAGETGGVVCPAGVEIGRCGERAAVAGGVVVEGGGGDVGQDLAAGPVEDPQPAAGGHRADHRGLHLPAPAHRHHGVEVARLDDGQHPLLGLAGHDLGRHHPGLPEGHGAHVDVHPEPAVGRDLARGAAQTGAAQVLDADDEVGVEQRQAGLDQPLLLERVTDLDARPLGLVAVGELGRGQHAHPADAVTAGRRSQQHGQVADTFGPGQDEPLVAHEADAGHVDERVAREALPDGELAAHRGDADRVAVARDPADHALHDPAVRRRRIVERAEVQGVEQCDGSGAHGEDVADDAADAGGRALVGLDGGGVVVALDAHGDGDAVPDVDHAGVLAEAGEDPRRLERQPPEVDPGRLVRAVLRPHHCVHGQLELVGRPAEKPGDGVGLVVGQTQLAMEGRRHGRQPTGYHNSRAST